ncbi:MAG: hypothetical protein AAGI51_11855 [Pseudomonadota bacterium]
MLYGRATPDPARDQIVFIHIRKTAGTALAAALAEGLGAKTPAITHWGAQREERGLLALHGPVRRAAVNLREQAAAAVLRLQGREVPLMENQPFFAGHFVLGEEPPGPRPRFYVTVTRDPAERFLSDHAFMARKRDRARSDCLDHALYDLPLEAFVAAIEARPEVYLHDYQCRQLAHGAPDAQAACEAVDETLWLAAPMTRLDAFLETAGAALGVSFPPLATVRRTPGKRGAEALPPDLLARIRALNPGDARLHSHVCAAFERL